MPEPTLARQTIDRDEKFFFELLTRCRAWGCTSRRVCSASPICGVPSSGVTVNRITCERAGRRTSITVRDWPSDTAPWRVSASSGQGRDLVCVGYHQWQPDVEVGSVRLHIETGKPLLVTAYLLGALHSDDRKDVLAALLMCAKEVAAELQRQVDVGTGALDWRLTPDDAESKQRMFPVFKHVHTRRDRRGTVTLRWS